MNRISGTLILLALDLLFASSSSSSSSRTFDASYQGGGGRLLLFARAVSPVPTNATCLNQYNWADNQKKQSPCLTAAWLLGACPASPWTVFSLNDVGASYPPPNVTTGTNDACSCSWVVYNLIQACTICQSLTPGQFNETSWDVWKQQCQGLDSANVYFPLSVEIPDQTSIPYYATTNPLTWAGDTFNATSATALHDELQPDITQQNRAGRGSTPAPSTKKSAPVGAIAGGVVGGVAALALLAGAFFYRRAVNQKKYDDEFDSDLHDRPPMRWGGTNGMVMSGAVSPLSAVEIQSARSLNMRSPVNGNGNARHGHTHSGQSQRSRGSRERIVAEPLSYTGGMRQPTNVSRASLTSGHPSENGGPGPGPIVNERSRRSSTDIPATATTNGHAGAPHVGSGRYSPGNYANIPPPPPIANTISGGVPATPATVLPPANISVVYSNPDSSFSPTTTRTSIDRGGPPPSSFTTHQNTGSVSRVNLPVGAVPPDFNTSSSGDNTSRRPVRFNPPAYTPVAHTADDQGATNGLALTHSRGGSDPIPPSARPGGVPLNARPVTEFGVVSHSSVANGTAYGGGYGRTAPG